MRQFRLYYPEELYDPKYRGQLFPLLKPFLKNKEYSDAERIKLYATSSSDFILVKDAAQADVIVIPMSWNYYVINKKREQLIEFLQRHSKLGKKFFIYNSGDIGLKMPHFENVLIFRLTVNKLPKPENVIIIPPFIQDPLRTQFKSLEISSNPYMITPLIGFCGFAKSSKLDAFKELTKIFSQNILSMFSLRNEEPQQLLSSSYFRGELLRRLTRAKNIRTNFIVRKNYRAGIKTDNNSHPTVVDFFNNLKESDYTLCARGSGNFSIRFYETLALGRIPVYVNTKGALPLENAINWKNHVVWVEKENVHQMAKILCNFHGQLDSESFLDLQNRNRKLWEEQLRLGPYFKNVIASLILNNAERE